MCDASLARIIGSLAVFLVVATSVHAADEPPSDSQERLTVVDLEAGEVPTHAVLNLKKQLPSSLVDAYPYANLGPLTNTLPKLGSSKIFIGLVVMNKLDFYNVHVYPRDMGRSVPKDVIETISRVAQNRSTFQISILRPTADGIEASRLTSSKPGNAQKCLSTVENAIERGTGFRLALTDAEALIVVSPDDSDHLREQAIFDYRSKAYKELDNIAITNQNMDAKQKESFESATDELFSKLGRRNLINDKMDICGLIWDKDKQHPPETPFALQSTKAAKKFVKTLSESAIGENCTVLIMTTRGGGATLRATKGSGDSVELDEPSATSQSLERARYTFESIRSGIKTGSKGPVDCTNDTQHVTIEEK